MLPLSLWPSPGVRHMGAYPSDLSNSYPHPSGQTKTERLRKRPARGLAEDGKSGASSTVLAYQTGTWAPDTTDG